MTLAARVTLASFALAGCRVADVDLSGKACPCPADGWVCNPTTNTCQRDPFAGDAHRDDTNVGREAAPPEGLAASCLSVPAKTTPLYATNGFADFGSAWVTKGTGMWSIDLTKHAIQTSTAAQLAVAQTVVNVNDYRLVSTFHATSTGNGKAIELAARITINLVVAPNVQHLYHCNWEPSDGQFMIQRDDNATGGGATPVSVTVDTSMIPGYTTSMPITMEFQAVGTTLACCIQGFPADKVLVTTDATYATGAVGLKTYEMSAVYDNFAVFD